MGNPLVHTLVIVAAIIIPGGLLVYFAWRAARKVTSSKADLNQNDDTEEYGYIPETVPDPDEAREAFRRMYPHYPPDSLRARQKLKQLRLFRLYKTRPRK